MDTPARKPRPVVKNTKLMADIGDALKKINYGSLEIYVQNGQVTQITTRSIMKTQHSTKN